MIERVQREVCKAKVVELVHEGEGGYNAMDICVVVPFLAQFWCILPNCCPALMLNLMVLI